jgi:AraC family transcriptional activator of pobA
LDLPASIDRATTVAKSRSLGIMEESLGARITGATTRMTRRRADGAPVYGYERLAGVPPVSVVRFLGPQLPPGERAHDHAHAHEFLVLAYFERAGGSLRINGRESPIAAGDAFVIAPGEVVAASDADGLHTADAWTAFFPPEILQPQTPGAFLSWRTHPLLFPFVRHAAQGAQRLRVPPDERAAWSERFSALECELRQRRDGYNEAVLAHLTLLLVSASRLAADVIGDLRLHDEPLLAAVFEYIERHYREPISLKDVARAVGLSPGHLTTTVGRKTGRTVQQWITERRMTEARRALVETDLTVETIGAGLGYRDPSYFIKSFKRTHTLTPLQWRRADRAQVVDPAPRRVERVRAGGAASQRRDSLG